METLKKKKKQQKGFTLIEFMVVIALIGLGLVLVVTQFGQANAANKSSTAIKNITSLSGGISSFKSARTGYDGVTHAQLVKTNAVPDNMIVSGALTNVFGGAVLVGPNGTDTNKYKITYPGVDEASCIEIGSRMNSSFVSIKVGTTAITNMATAVTACTPATSGATVDMTFVGN